MSGVSFDALTVLKEYGLAGVLAWLFWWTLRKMMASHDTTVQGLKEQVEVQAAGMRAASERFSQVVQNHMSDVVKALARFDVSLTRHAEEQRRWQDRLLHTLDKIGAHLSREGRA